MSRSVSRVSSPTWTPHLVARVVWDTYRHFDAHPTRDVVPILVQDAARDRLRVMPTAARPAHARAVPRR